MVMSTCIEAVVSWGKFSDRDEEVCASGGVHYISVSASVSSQHHRQTVVTTLKPPPPPPPLLPVLVSVFSSSLLPAWVDIVCMARKKRKRCGNGVSMLIQLMMIHAATANPTCYIVTDHWLRV